jgi:hypothetical protein
VRGAGGPGGSSSPARTLGACLALAGLLAAARDSRR